MYGIRDKKTNTVNPTIFMSSRSTTLLILENFHESGRSFLVPSENFFLDRLVLASNNSYPLVYFNFPVLEC